MGTFKIKRMDKTIYGKFMKICVVSLFTKEIENESRLSTLNKKKYCEKYNIDYKFFLGRLSKRHAQWDKIQCLIQTLPHYDYVIWMDSDTVFNNFDISLIDFINENKEYDSLFCSDVCYEVNSKHLLVNAGVMIFKNTDWSLNYLNKVWVAVPDYNIENLDKHSYEGFPWEQGKICEELLKENTSKYKIFPHTTFNCHPSFKNDSTFIVHFMGSRQSITHINDFVEKVNIINQKFNIDSNENINLIPTQKVNQNLKVDTDIILVKNYKLTEKFREKEINIEIDIINENENYYVKYIWDYKNTGLDYLSHSFKIKNNLEEKILDFDSQKNGKFKINYTDNFKIFHSYNWFGEVKWNEIQ